MEYSPTWACGASPRQPVTPMHYFGNAINYQQVNSGFFVNQYDACASYKFQSPGLAPYANRGCIRYPCYPHNSILHSLSTGNAGGPWWITGANTVMDESQGAHLAQPLMEGWAGHRDLSAVVKQDPVSFSIACQSATEYPSPANSVNQRVSTGSGGGPWWNNGVQPQFIQRRHDAQPHLGDLPGRHGQSAGSRQEPGNNSERVGQYPRNLPNSVNMSVSTGNVCGALWNNGHQPHWHDFQRTHLTHSLGNESPYGHHNQTEVVKQEPTDHYNTCQSITRFHNNFEDTQLVLECNDDLPSSNYPYQQITRHIHQNDGIDLEANHLRAAGDVSQKVASAGDVQVPPNGCVACGESFNKNSEMKKHFHKMHVELICEFCGKTFYDDDSFKKHYRIHTSKPGQLFCMICGKGFDDEEKLRCHQDLHTKLHKCKGCSLVFLNRKVLDLHFKIRPQCKKNPGDVQCRSSGDESTSSCNETDIDASVHKPKVCKSKTKKPPKKLWAFKCCRCWYGFDEEGRYNFHVKYRCTYRVFACDICTDEFSDRTKFENHMLNAHSETHPFKCDWCKSEIRFAQCNELAHHVWYKHLKPTLSPFTRKCFCGEKFISEHALAKHRVSHTGVLPHSCDICGKSFLRSENLSVHRRVHTGERPFVCSYCGRGFRKRMILVYHERLHSGDRPFTCNICEKSFVDSSSHGRHMRQKHGAKLKVRVNKQWLAVS